MSFIDVSYSKLDLDLWILQWFGVWKKANFKERIGYNIHFENKNAPSKKKLPQHVKVCRQKWRHLRCSAVGRFKNLEWEKIIFDENWIVMLLVLPNLVEVAPVTLQNPPALRWYVTLQKCTLLWHGQRCMQLVWSETRYFSLEKKNYTLAKVVAKVHFFATLHSEHDYLLSKCIIFQWRDIMIIDIIKRIKSSNVGWRGMTTFLLHAIFMLRCSCGQP